MKDILQNACSELSKATIRKSKDGSGSGGEVAAPDEKRLKDMTTKNEMGILDPGLWGEN